MKNKALIVIDLQNDITKNYKMIIGQVNRIPKVLNWFLNLRLPQRMFLKSQKPVR